MNQNTKDLLDSKSYLTGNCFSQHCFYFICLWSCYSRVLAIVTQIQLNSFSSMACLDYGFTIAKILQLRKMPKDSLCYFYILHYIAFPLHIAKFHQYLSELITGVLLQDGHYPMKGQTKFPSLTWMLSLFVPQRYYQYLTLWCKCFLCRQSFCLETSQKIYHHHSRARYQKLDLCYYSFSMILHYFLILSESSFLYQCQQGRQKIRIFEVPSTIRLFSADHCLSFQIQSHQRRFN